MLHHDQSPKLHVHPSCSRPLLAKALPVFHAVEQISVEFEHSVGSQLKCMVCACHRKCLYGTQTKSAIVHGRLLWDDYHYFKSTSIALTCKVVSVGILYLHIDIHDLETSHAVYEIIV